VKAVTAAQAESTHYYVYVCRIGGVMRYVGKGSGYRRNRHKRASHNHDLKALIADANANCIPVRIRVIASDLTNVDALRLEGRCFDKWRHTIVNKNNPRRANDWERDEAEEAAMAAEGNAMLGYHDEHLEALYAFEDGTLSHEEAAEWGFVESERDEASISRT
jgi:hypothetical protein